MKKTIDEREPVTNEQLGKTLELAFSTRFFSLSEIVFDKGHRHAIVSYSLGTAGEGICTVRSVDLLNHFPRTQQKLIALFKTKDLLFSGAESRWSVSTVCKFGLLDALKLCLAPEYVWDTMETQFSLFRIGFSAQYAWILHRPWKIMRGYS